MEPDPYRRLIGACKQCGKPIWAEDPHAAITRAGIRLFFCGGCMMDHAIPAFSRDQRRAV